MKRKLMIGKIADPYNENGRCNFPHKDYGKKPGVYLIRYKGSKEWCYIGKGRNVYKQLYSHFQKYINRDIIIKGVAYKNFAVNATICECAIILTDNEGEVEAQLIHKLNPTNNKRIPQYSEEIEMDIDPLAHLDWSKIEKTWEEYIKKHNKPPF